MTARTVHLRVTKDAARHLRRGHPWLYASSITKAPAHGAPGDTAVIHDEKNELVAVGLYDPTSEIRVRALHAGAPIAVDDALVDARLGESIDARAGLYQAAERRSRVVPAACFALSGGFDNPPSSTTRRFQATAPTSLPQDPASRTQDASKRSSSASCYGPDTTGLRLVYGESDRLPGLVVDRYGTTLVVKVYTAAWGRFLDAILASLVERVAPETIVVRTARNVSDDAGAGLVDGRIARGALPDDRRVSFLEHGLTFLCDPIRGQKTGFFLDHRDNRARVGARARGKRVLNVFSYTGGFSLHAARGGATRVVSVDQSAPALADAARIFAANHAIPGVAACAHTPIVDDAFRALDALAGARERFDLVVIDPPSFAHRIDQRAGALESYARLVKKGLLVLEDGGELVFASCTRLVDAETLQETVTAAAARAGRPLVVDEVTLHPPDHPVRFAESAYLKCLWTRG